MLIQLLDFEWIFHWTRDTTHNRLLFSSHEEYRVTHSKLNVSQRNLAALIRNEMEQRKEKKKKKKIKEIEH